MRDKNRECFFSISSEQRYFAPCCSSNYVYHYYYIDDDDKIGHGPGSQHARPHWCTQKWKQGSLLKVLRRGSSVANRKLLSAHLRIPSEVRSDTLCLLYAHAGYADLHRALVMETPAPALLMMSGLGPATSLLDSQRNSITWLDRT